MAAIFVPNYDLPVENRPRPAPPRLRVVEGGRQPFSAVRRRRRRLVARVALALAVVALLLASAMVFSLVDAASRPPAAAVGSGAITSGGPVVVVQAGDTLTSIARQLQPTGDTTALVDRLAALHGPAPLEPGDRIPTAPLGLPTSSGR